MCKHSAPSNEFTDFRSWFQYQLDSEAEILQLLKDLGERKSAKTSANKAALVETKEIARLTLRQNLVVSNIRTGLLLEALEEAWKTGRIELENPDGQKLRFCWLTSS